MIEKVWLIPLIMFLAALVNGLGTRKLGKLAGHIAWISMAVCFLLSVGIFFEVRHLAHTVPHWPGVEVNL